MPHGSVALLYFRSRTKGGREPMGSFFPLEGQQADPLKCSLIIQIPKRLGASSSRPTIPACQAIIQTRIQRPDGWPIELKKLPIVAVLGKRRGEIRMLYDHPEYYDIAFSFRNLVKHNFQYV
jgi:hypothetical protein